MYLNRSGNSFAEQELRIMQHESKRTDLYEDLEGRRATGYRVVPTKDTDGNYESHRNEIQYTDPKTDESTWDTVDPKPFSTDDGVPVIDDNPGLIDVIGKGFSAAGKGIGAVVDWINPFD